MKKLLLTLLLIVAAAAAFYVHLGYYNGPVFRDLPAADPDPERPAIVILSGDMGNTTIGMTPKIAAHLHRQGYTVVTANSLTYFSSRRTAGETTALIEQAMSRAQRLGKTRNVVLIGQSFGADMLHAGLAGMPAGMRTPIRAVILVVPEQDIVFRASPVELAGFETPDQLAYPTAARLTWVPVTCIQGQEETDSLCPELHMPNVRRIVLPGGHNLHRDDDTLAAAILPAIRSE